jgi:hypothetical protein
MSHFTDEYWHALFDDCKNSGLSQRVYCKKNEIKLTTFRYYFDKLIRKTYPKPKKRQTKLSPAFEPVLISKKPHESSKPITLTLNLGNQITCEIQTEVSQLALILNEVKGLC